MNLIELGQADNGGERDDDRHDAADLEQNRPAILRNEGRTREAGERAAERHQSYGDNCQRGSQVARRRFGVDGNDVRDHAADPETGKKPQPG